MDINRSQQQPGAAGKTASAVMQQDPGVRRMDPGAAPSPAPTENARKSSHYGLPCSKCHLYYPADVDICPTCHSTERVSPVVTPRSAPAMLKPTVEAVPDTTVVEQEREEFLRQFKSQLFTAHAEVGSAPSVCTLGEHHSGGPESAEVCKPCYDRLQERLDIYEAAMHIELKEAAQIIYDAVWADPSDPTKTYQNAASAILSELRKRSGMTTVLGPFQPLAH